MNVEAIASAVKQEFAAKTKAKAEKKKHATKPAVKSPTLKKNAAHNRLY